jgi:mono/diheme cytochrome c family protein
MRTKGGLLCTPTLYLMRKMVLQLMMTVLLGFLAGAMLGCPASKKPSKWEARLANMAKDVVIPVEAKNLKNPLAQNPDAAQEGQKIFMGSCAMCHGTDGHARTSLGLAMYPPAMDLTSPHVQHWTDAELFWIIQNGVRLTGMPAWKSMISETDSWKLVNFIRMVTRLQPAALPENQAKPGPLKTELELITYGKTLYRQEGCFMCHKLNDDGGDVGPDLSVEGNRGRTADWLIGHFKDPPAYTPGSVMLAFNELTDEQLRALVAFLQAQKGGK